MRNTPTTLVKETEAHILQPETQGNVRKGSKPEDAKHKGILSNLSFRVMENSDSEPKQRQMIGLYWLDYDPTNIHYVTRRQNSTYNSCIIMETVEQISYSLAWTKAEYNKNAYSD